MIAKHPMSATPCGACSCGTLRKASRRISQLYDAALAPSGLKSTQFAILAEVQRADGSAALTLCELAGAMVMDRSTLGHNLRPLQRDRLVVMRLARDDRRKRYVELTPKGKAVYRRARGLWRNAERQFEKAFGKRPAAQLRAVLHGIATNDSLMN
jgi:DNA-binding MarR family transcriptional regulator